MFCSSLQYRSALIVFRKSPRPSLPLKRAPPLTPTLSPSGEREETAQLGAQNRCALRLADHQRSRHIVRDGTALSQLAGWECLNSSSPQYRSALVATRMRYIIFILLLIGLPRERCPSGLWRKSYDRHWHLMNDHNDRGCHL